MNTDKTIDNPGVMMTKAESEATPNHLAEEIAEA
jgi:hypothetical protein